MRFLEELLASDKDCAELVMITDLIRSDLGRVSATGSIHVPELRTAVSHSNVHHTLSRVTGRLRPEVDLADLLRATFPGGSVTGAPKIKAMEIIETLEPTARGPYCGATGYIGVDGAMDLNIAIRTVLCEGGRMTFQVGGGIVAESSPPDEFEAGHLPGAVNIQLPDLPDHLDSLCRFVYQGDHEAAKDSGIRNVSRHVVQNLVLVQR